MYFNYKDTSVNKLINIEVLLCPSSVINDELEQYFKVKYM